MADNAKSSAGLTLGGALVIAGILIVIFWSFWIGLVVGLVGLVAFGASLAAAGTKSDPA